MDGLNIDSMVDALIHTSNTKGQTSYYESDDEIKCAFCGKLLASTYNKATEKYDTLCDCQDAKREQDFLSFVDYRKDFLHTTTKPLVIQGQIAILRKRRSDGDRILAALEDMLTEKVDDCIKDSTNSTGAKENGEEEQN